MTAIPVSASPEQAAHFATIAELYGADTGAVLLALACDRLELPAIGDHDHAMLLYASAALALLGLVGVPLFDMQIRNIGILGYVVLFPIAAGVMAVLFHRERGEGVA